MIATDVAARGIDIERLPYVVNFELPRSPNDYIHRIGRTGRAGNEGEAMSLVCVDELKLLKDIEKLIKREIPKDVVEGYEPDPSIKAQPITRGRGQQQQKRPARKKAGRPGKNARRKSAENNAAGNVSASPWKKRSNNKRRSNNQNRNRDAA